MQEKTIICIMCPIGCQINIKEKKGAIESMDGYRCKRGKSYAINEFNHPVRIFTSSIQVQDGQIPLIPVRSSQPIPKELIFKCIEEIKKIKVNTPVYFHEVIITNILNTNTDIISTGEIV